MRRVAIVLLTLAGLAGLTRQTCGEVLYTITDLGTLGGTQSYATAINDHGQVVGVGYLPGGWVEHAFRTAPNSPINAATDDLGPFGAIRSAAYGINNAGQVVGEMWLGNAGNHPFQTAANSAINPTADNLGPLLPGESYARGINASGQVVGWWTQWNHGFRTTANTPINFPFDDLGQQHAKGYAINDSGQVAGSIGPSSDPTIAFRTGANASINPLTDYLGTLGGRNSEARAINNGGQVAGWSDIAGNGAHHAFLYSGNGPMQDLGTLGGTSEAYGINDKGQVVGQSNGRAFLFDSSSMIDLSTVIDPAGRWILYEANDINNLGQIVGVGQQGPTGDSHAVLLTPVPEPGTAAALAGLAMAGSFLAWRRRGRSPVILR